MSALPHHWTVRPMWLLAALTLLAAACGLPVGEPEALSQEGWEDLLEGTTTTTITPVADDAGETVEIQLFFIASDDNLERVTRTYPDSPQINEVLLELEDPPRPEEQEEFAEAGLLLRSLVPVGLNPTLLTETPADAARGVRVLSVETEGGLRELLEAEPLTSRLVVSQLVCTFLNLPRSETTSGVEIQDGEGPLLLADIDSQPINRPAAQSDFGDCRTGTEAREELVEEAEQAENDDAESDAASTTTTELGP